MSAKHTVFVLNNEGRPLTPTTPARARKLLKAGVATPV
ncbi:MAG: RRXRR domain-containing protein, partial [Chloroflexi bacterium]|nr:RRXRR domain-containing protein [Chloroflexota bacterium]MCI0711588.1 RRXRR domain-containing protein [Chloroflexota bacterium]